MLRVNWSNHLSFLQGESIFQKKNQNCTENKKFKKTATKNFEKINFFDLEKSMQLKFEHSVHSYRNDRNENNEEQVSH